MKKFLRVIAAVAALTVALTALSACGDKENDKNDDNALATGDVNGEDSIPEEPQIPAGLYVDGELVEDCDALPMITLDDVVIPFDEYRYFYKYFVGYYGFTDQYWIDNPDLFKSFIEIVDYSVMENYWGALLANKHGIELTEEDNAKVDELIGEQVAQFGSQEEFESAMGKAGINENLLRRIISQSVLSERVYLELYGGETPILLPSKDEIKAELKSDYVRAKNLLISNDHFDEMEGYEEYTPEQLADEVKKLAEDLLARLQNGEDIDALIEEYGDDPGAVANPDGYVFTYGQMVKSFEDAAYELNEGEISGLVETDYGYHIIMKMPLDDEYIDANWDTCKEAYIEVVFNSYVNESLDSAEVVYSETHDNLTYESIR